MGKCQVLVYEYKPVKIEEVESEIRKAFKANMKEFEYTLQDDGSHDLAINYCPLRITTHELEILANMWDDGPLIQLPSQLS